MLYHVSGKARPILELERLFVACTLSLQVLYHILPSRHRFNSSGSGRDVSRCARFINVGQQSVPMNMSTPTTGQGVSSMNMLLSKNVSS